MATYRSLRWCKGPRAIHFALHAASLVEARSVSLSYECNVLHEDTRRLFMHRRLMQIDLHRTKHAWRDRTQPYGNLGTHIDTQRHTSSHLGTHRHTTAHLGTHLHASAHLGPHLRGLRRRNIRIRFNTVTIRTNRISFGVAIKSQKKTCVRSACSIIIDSSSQRPYVADHCHTQHFFIDKMKPTSSATT